MHLLSVIFSAFHTIVLTCDTTPIKIHIEIEGQSVNVIRLQPPNESLYDTTMFNNFPTIKGGKVFDFKYQLKQSSFLSIVINNELYIPYVLSPKDSISIKIKRIPNSNYPQYEYQFSGSNSVAQQIYRKKFYPPGRNFAYFADLSKKVKTYSDYYISSKKYIDSLTSVWDSLRALHLLTEDSYKLYTADTKGILYNGAIRKIASVKTDSSWGSYLKWVNIRNVMFYHGNASNPILLKTPFAVFLYETYLKNILREDDAITDTLIKSADIGYYYYFDSLYREQSWGRMLWILKKQFPNSTSKADLLDFKVFQSYYPHSVYVKNILQFQDSVLRERKALTDTINIKNESHQTLNDIFSSLTGRYFFIDIWATWCGPCIQEFNYFTRVSKFMFSKNIKEVFFSIDRETDRALWNKFINDQHITGNHFLIAEKVQKELLTILSRDQSQSALSIPRYLLYDKLLNKYYIDLPRPSSGEALELFIEDILKKK